jgi:tetratricopeptide (TPR) repeat protein
MKQQAFGPQELAGDPMALMHYQIRSCLGEGGFGQVFEAWDSKLRRNVAIKRLKNAPDGPHADGLIKEAQLAASLQHAAFVKIYALEDDDDNSQSIVMELVRGQTLKQLLADAPPDQAKVLDIVRQIAEAMQEAHDADLIHGDLKPSNLMLEPSGAVRILDFGLAAQGDAEATTSLLQTDPQGTIAYMAPERLLGAPLRRQSDIYALGVILYELLTGARPFANLSGLALAAAHMQSSSDQWGYPADMDAALVSMIRTMTAKEPKLRLQGMEQVAGLLAQMAEPMRGPTALPQAPPAPRLGKRTRMVLLALFSCGLLGVGAWQFLPYVAQSPMIAPPFSEALEMKNGLAALRVFDRPGSLDSATKSFTRILEHNPQNAAAVAGMALAYSYRYQSDGRDEIWLQKADAAAQQAMTLNDQLALSHVAKAFVWLQQGKWEMGLDESERALGLEPMNFFAWSAKLGALRSLRRGDEARKYIELAMQRFPEERLFVDEMGRFLIEKRDLKNAEKVLRHSIVLQPDAVYSYAMLAELLKRQNRQDEALQVLQQGLQIRPNAMLYGNLGNVMFARGDYVAAAHAFEYAVSPGKGDPDDYLGWANLADALLWIPGRGVEAKNAYEKARQLLAPRLARRKSDFTLVSRMGLYAARTGNKAEAETLITQAVNLARSLPDVQFRAGLAYELLGDRDMALVTISKAKNLGYPIKLIEAEPDLVALRRDPGYLKQ